MIFAHSLDTQTEEDWEPLSDHLALVGKMAAEFATAFGAATLGDVAGRLHDIGKVSGAYQAYIRGNGAIKGPDHSTAGAKRAVQTG